MSFLFWSFWHGRSYLPNHSARTGYGTRSIFKRSLAGLNSEFSFSLTSCLTKAEEPSLPCYLPIAGGRIIGFIPLPRVLVLCEMQSVLSRNWTRFTVSISCDDNHYTTGTSDMGDKWPRSCWFLGRCVQDLFRIARNTLTLFPSSYFVHAFRLNQFAESMQ